jgi:DNA-binding GntR family transcriptional regulator
MATMHAAATSVTQSAYTRLRELILTGEIPPGEKILLKVLSTQLQVNLSALREALSRLSAEGLVVAEPQRGFRAAPFSLEDLRHLSEARIEIETSCLRQAIDKGDLGWEGRVADAAHQLARLSGKIRNETGGISCEWALAHDRLHFALCSGCDNTWMLRIREMLYTQSERYRSLAGPLAGGTRDIDAEHREIVDASLARDALAACALLAAHLRSTAEILMDTYKSGDRSEIGEASPKGAEGSCPTEGVHPLG